MAIISLEGAQLLVNRVSGIVSVAGGGQREVTTHHEMY
jgi:hypothetical protein